MEEHLAKDNGLKLDGLTYRLGRKLTVDAKTESFVGDPEANALLTRDYRKPFVVPERSPESGTFAKRSSIQAQLAHFPLPHGAGNGRGCNWSAVRMLRLITVPQKTSDTPLADLSTEGFPLRHGQGRCKEATRYRGKLFGVDYFFGRDLRQAVESASA